jgi:transcriptional regulator with XRE-family HTH domain
LDELGWSQKEFVALLHASPQQVNKMVKGKENLTLETQIKLRAVLDIPVFASYHESKKGKSEKAIQFQKQTTVACTNS